MTPDDIERWGEPDLCVGGLLDQTFLPPIIASCRAILAKYPLRRSC